MEKCVSNKQMNKLKNAFFSISIFFKKKKKPKKLSYLLPITNMLTQNLPTREMLEKY